MTNDLERGVEGESPFLDGRPPFLERLKAHDDLVSPELLRIERACQEGVVDAEWYAQQTAVLLHRVLAFEESEVRQLRGTRSLRATTKRELARRVALVTDYIHANYRHRLDLRTLAAEAGLSPYHLLRVFHAICGVTPQEFLQRKRVTVARRLLANTGLSATRVASLVGFRSRSSLYRWMRRV
jgi:AraC family transcriptional regulator